MSTHWFYARGFGISHISTLTRIFLDLRTTDIPCDLIRLHKPSEVFNTLSSHDLNVLQTCPPSPKILLCVHTSCIITPSNIRYKLPTCYNTSEEPSQACIQISYHISEASGAPSHISEYYPYPKLTCPEYLVLFTHAPQTIYRIFKDLRILPISLPQHSRHIDFYCMKLCTGTHSSIYPFPSIRPLCLHLLKFSITFGSVAKHSHHLSPFSELIGTYSSLIYSFLCLFLFLSPFVFLSFSSHFLHVSCFGSLSFYSYLLHFRFRIFSNICTPMYL